MTKRTIAIILEILPVISAPISFALLMLDFDSAGAGGVRAVTMLLAFLGFAFFFVGRKLAKGDLTVRILGVLDWLATVYVILIYAIAILSFGL